MGTAGAVLELIVNPDIEVKVVKPKSPRSARWLGVKPLNLVFEVLLRAVETILKVAEP